MARRVVMWSSLAIMVTIGFTVEAQTNGPHLTCDQPVCDYGVRDNKKDVEHTFVLQNNGTLPLIISQVRAGCGCTTTALNTNTIPPGGMARLEAKLSLRGIVGAKRATIYVQSNDPQIPVWTCYFTGTAVTELDIAPPQLAFAATVGSPPGDQQVKIVNRTDTPLHITGVETSSFFTAEVTTNTEGRAYTVTVRLSAGLEPPGANGILALTTDHPGYARLEIPVSVTVQTPIAALPPLVVLNRGNVGNAEARYVMLRSTREVPFAVTSIETAPSGLPVSIQSVKPIWTRLRVGPVATAGLTGGVIRVHTDLPAMPEIAIPVRVEP